MTDQHMTSPRTLSGLPTELRLEIWDLVFQSITVEIERGAERAEESFTELETEGDGPQITIRNSAKRGMSPSPAVPEEVLAVKLACREFAREIGSKWHSAVTYSFPSTVAFVDVLSQWSKERVSALRYVYVCDTPFPIYPYDSPDCYHSHEFADVIAMFPGLELHNLTVENIWLFPSGKPIDGFCEVATLGAIQRLLPTKGWRTLHYASGILPLTPRQHRQTQEIVEEFKRERNEPGFVYDLNELRPRRDRAVKFVTDGTRVVDEEAVAEVEQWYAQNPELGPPEDFSDDKETLELAVWARRGAKVDCVEDGTTLSPAIKGLLEHMTWVQLREIDDYLVDDGLDSPIGHL